jgi:hypothetical protein
VGPAARLAAGFLTIHPGPAEFGVGLACILGVETLAAEDDQTLLRHS